VISRYFAAPVYAGAAFLFGMSLGERGELGVVQHLFTAVIPLATVVMTFVAKQGRAYVVVTGLAIILGLLLGQRQFENAWRDCITSGERVRTALLATQGDYPPRLEDLDIELPCRCGFRTTILHYLSNDRGFRLWMTNDRQTFVATDKRPFTASGKSSDRRGT
jgi:phage-related protein